MADIIAKGLEVFEGGPGLTDGYKRRITFSGKVFTHKKIH
jgi:hypothetical protein